MAEFYLSPDIYLEERDLSGIVNATATSTAAIVGASKRGPVNKRVFVTNTRQFIELFGEPDPQVDFLHYGALAYLEHGNSLYVTRVVNNAKYAAVVINGDGASAATAPVSSGADNEDSFDFSSYPDAVFAVIAENPGQWGNDVTVRVTATDPNAYTFDIEVYAKDEQGTDALVEVWSVSRQAKKDGFGRQLYLVDRINDQSKYIRVVDNTAQANTILPKYTASDTLGTGDDTTVTFSGTLSQVPLQKFSVDIYDGSSVVASDDGFGNIVGTGVTGTVNYDTGAITVTFSTAPASGNNITAQYYAQVVAPLSGGNDGAAVTASDIINGWNLYASAEEVDVRILINSGWTDIAVQQRMTAICEDRKDCIAVLDAPSDKQEPSPLVLWRRNTQNISSSYAALYAPDLYILDTFNDKRLYVPISGFMAGLYALRDKLTAPWDAPAGFDMPLRVIDVRHHYDKGARDILYPNNVNPVRVFPGQGIYPWGQKTLQAQASARDRVNVRRLLIVLEKAMTTAAYRHLFKRNNVYTRLSVVSELSAYLERIKNAGGLYDYRVVCDETNNPPSTDLVDASILKVDVLLKPVRMVEFMPLRVTITNTNAVFDEVVVSTAA